MSDERGGTARSPGGAHDVTRSGPASDRERVLLLECRLEQMRSSLDAARKEADTARMETAEISAREADHVRRFALLHEELAEARTRIAELHRALDRADALREELAGHLFEGGGREDAEELIRLRREALAEDQRALRADRTVQRLRDRVDELLTSRELLLTRVAEWQQLIRKGEPEAADLSEFLADLRREILDLEHRGAASDAREQRLRRRLSRAGMDPDLEPDEPEVAEEETVAPVPGLVGFVSHGPPAGDASHRDGDDTGRGHGASAMDRGAPTEADEVEVVGPEEGGVSVSTDAEDSEDSAAEPGEEPAAAELRPGHDDDPDAPATAGREAAPVEEGVATSGRFAAASAKSEALLAELRDMAAPALQTDLLLRLGRSGDMGAVGGVALWTGSSEPSVRAAAYEALGRLLERAPQELEPHLRTGLADPDGRVRRRVVLAMATARAIPVQTLLDPLREDPDPQVRRVVRQVLRQNRSRGGRPEAEAPSARPNRSLANRPSAH